MKCHSPGLSGLHPVVEEMTSLMPLIASEVGGIALFMAKLHLVSLAPVSHFVKRS